MIKLSGDIKITIKIKNTLNLKTQKTYSIPSQIIYGKDYKILKDY